MLERCFFSYKMSISSLVIFTLDAQSKLTPRAANTSITIKLSLHFTAKIEKFVYK